MTSGFIVMLLGEMERKAQKKGKGRKRKFNHQDVEETENPKNKEAECSKSKVVPTFNKRKRVTKKKESCKSDEDLPNKDDQPKDPNQDRDEEEDTQGSVPDDSQLDDTANSTPMLQEQREITNISYPANIEPEDMNKCSSSESSSKSLEQLESTNTTEVSIEDMLPASPSYGKSKVINNMSDKEGLDLEITTEYQIEHKALQSQSTESGMMTGLIEVPPEIPLENVETPSKSTELPEKNTELHAKNSELHAKNTELCSIGKELAVKDTDIPVTITEEDKDDTPLVQLKGDHNKENNGYLEQIRIKQETTKGVEENANGKEEHSIDKQKSHIVQKCGEETPEAVQSGKEIPLPVPKPLNDASDPAADPLRKVDQQYSLVEQTGSSNQLLKEAEQSGTCLIEKECAISTQEFKTDTMKCLKFKTTNESSTVISNENNFESQPLHKDTRKCFSLEDNDIDDRPKGGDMKHNLISTSNEEQERQPIDSYGERDVDEEKTDLLSKEKKSLLGVSSPEKSRTDMKDKPPCDDGLEGDMDITDSQLCEAVNIQESHSTISCLEEAKKRHLEGRKIIHDLIVDLSFLNKMLLRTKRELESARRRKQPVGNRNSW